MRPRSETSQAAVLAAIYLLVGALWIFFSDRELEVWITDSALLTRAQTWKGWFFIIATAVLLFFLARSALRLRARLVRREVATEKRYRDITEMTPFGIFHMDADGIVTYLNDMTVTLTGHPREDLMGNSWRSIVHDEDRERLVTRLGEAIQRKSPFRAECRLKRRDGNLVWVVGECRPQTDEHGRFSGFIGTVTDITERKLAEITLGESERRYSALTNLSSAGIYHAGAEGKLTFVNARLAQIAGVPAEQMLGDGWVAAVHADDREQVQSEWNHAVRQGREYQGQFRFRHPDGSITWVAEHTVPHHGERGSLTGFIGTMTDITGIKEVEEKLRHAESIRRQIFEAVPECVKVVARDGTLLDMNPAGLEMMEADSLQQVAGNSVAPVVAPEFRAEFERLHARVMQGESGTLQYESIGLKGTRRFLETHAVPLRDGLGQIYALLGITRDITASRAAGQRLLASEMLYRDLFESNPNIMCVFDEETLQFLEVNSAMSDHYGWSRDELLAMTVKEIRPLEEIPALLENLRDASPGLDLSRVSRHRKKNGDVIEVTVRSHTMKFAGRNARLALMNDVTEQRRTEAALARERAALQETSARLNQVLATTPMILYATRLHADNFTPVWVSESITRILGYSQNDALSPAWWIKNLHADDRPRIKAAIPELIRTGSLVIEYRFARKNGEIVWIRDEARVLSHADDGTQEIVGAWSDITLQRLAEERRRLDAAAFESTSDGVMIADLEARIISVNRAFIETTGYPEAELLGQTPRMLQSGRHARDFFQGMWYALSKAGLWRGEIWNRRKSGEIFPAWLTISTVYNDREEPTHYVAIYTDISKLKESEEKLKYLAHFDPLTDLPNRLLMQSRLEHAIAQAQRHSDHISVLFIDLDDFKQVNDSLGHVVGDELLVQVADRLRTRVRSEDTLARLGGDEFVVLLEKLDRPDGAATVARALLAALAAPFQLPGGRDIYVRSSIGISIFPDDGTTPAELLRAADTAMYQAKAGGGDRYLFFTSRMGAEVLAGMELEAALRRALELKELALHFQPRVDLRNGGIQGAEALLRWYRNGTGLVPPGEFIPVAEKSGLIVPIGNWVIDAACRQYRAWMDQGLQPMQIGVNVSARQFREEKLAQNITVALRKYDMPAGMLVLELTESMLMERVEEAVEVLQQLKGIGVQLSLDDFGTGFSSLSYLTRFPIDTLKIDRSFVCNVETDESAKTIVNLVINLAHGLGLKAVAEGVESGGQCHYLRKQGCDEMQGYFFSRPLPAEEFAALLLKGKHLDLGDRTAE